MNNEKVLKKICESLSNSVVCAENNNDKISNVKALLTCIKNIFNKLNPIEDAVRTLEMRLSLIEGTLLELRSDGIIARAENPNIILGLKQYYNIFENQSDDIAEMMINKKYYSQLFQENPF